MVVLFTSSTIFSHREHRGHREDFMKPRSHPFMPPCFHAVPHPFPHAAMQSCSHASFFFLNLNLNLIINRPVAG